MKCLPICQHKQQGTLSCSRILTSGSFGDILIEKSPHHTFNEILLNIALAAHLSASMHSLTGCREKSRYLGLGLGLGSKLGSALDSGLGLGSKLATGLDSGLC